MSGKSCGEGKKRWAGARKEQIKKGENVLRDTIAMTG